jgi:hypothetical protein
MVKGMGMGKRMNKGLVKQNNFFFSKGMTKKMAKGMVQV